MGVGASAGGLPALKTLLREIPPGEGLAFVVIQHLDPRAASAMATILSGHVYLRVVEAIDGMRVEADTVYTLPPAKELLIRDGTLRLRDRHEGRAGNFPIDTFFASLAEDQAENAIAVVLTGSGTDGAKGVVEVKARGGAVMAQAPSTAEQSSMPERAIATGVVDIVAPLEGLPERILAYARHAGRLLRGESALPILPDVLALLRDRTGLDLSGYKTGTLTRRIFRRVGLRRLDDPAEYLRILRTEQEELERLRKDILIGVTSFFRDPDAFEAIARDVLPLLFGDPSAPKEVRVWVSGCSTGEEAYSIAMLLLDERPWDGPTVRVFATDANEEAIDVARMGIYDDASVAAIPLALLRRYFDEGPPGRFKVRSELRSVVTFATQDLLSDPPFPKMDLITCRNVLIYLEQEVQRALLARFHFALRRGGFLFLGRSESMPADASFVPLSAKWRIFRRVDADGTRKASALAPRRIRPRAALPVRREEGDAARRDAPPTVAETAAEWLLRRYVPAAVVVDDHHRILAFHGPVERYLNLPRGEAALDLLEMAKEGLQSHLRTAVFRSQRGREPIRVTGGYLVEGEHRRPIEVRAEPITSERDGRDLLLVLFEDDLTTANPNLPAEAVPATGRDDVYLRQIEEELRSTKEDLLDTVQSAESQYEELQAANEEVTSMNEELRAANEELMASKEELQALNEEINSTSTQLRDRLESLEKVTDDLDNLLATTGIATLYLDPDFHIVRSTPALHRLVQVREGDVGRPIRELTWLFDDPNLLPDATLVLKDLVPREKEVRGRDGTRYQRRIIPYRMRDGQIEGVFITFRDIEEVLQAQEQVEAARADAESIVETIRVPLVVLDPGRRIVSANRAFYALSGLQAKRAVGEHFLSVAGGRWNVPALVRLIDGLLLTPAKPAEDVPVHIEVAGEAPCSFLVTGRRLARSAEGPRLLLMIASGERPA